MRNVINNVMGNLLLNLQDNPEIENSKQKLSEEEIGLIDYLKNSFNKLTINICGELSGDAFSLIKHMRLVGWCWQSTQTCSLFLDDDAIIERGNIFVESSIAVDNYKEPYYHSWICLNYKDSNYIFDPSLDILCKKNLYYKYFTPEVKGRTTAKEVKRHIIEHLHKGQTTIHGTEDVNAPIYRSSIDYTATLNDNEIQELDAHYYMG